MAEEVESWKSKDSSGFTPKDPGFIRRAMLCRILFVTKPGSFLRPPNFVYSDLPIPSMPGSTWPDLPMVQVNGVWFLLSENGGMGDFGSDTDWSYFNYCRENGRFRTTPLRLPTVHESRQALRSLFASKRWKSIRWKFREDRQGDNLSDFPVVVKLKSQVGL